MNLIEKFLQNLSDWGLEYYGRFYGTYRGIVHNNKDPDNRGKIWVKVPAVARDNVLSTMAYPKMPFGGADHGIFFPPEEGETVYVQFENGDPEFPIYEGGWWKAPSGETELPNEFKQDDPKNENPKRRGIKTAGGHFILFDDTEDAEKLQIQHKSGTQLLIDETGTIIITTKESADGEAKQTVTLDAANDETKIEDVNSNVVTINSDGLKIETTHGQILDIASDLINLITSNEWRLDGSKMTANVDTATIGTGASEPAVLGNQWKTYFTQFLNTWASTHNHSCGVGPTSPPIPPPPPLNPGVFSQAVKVK
jgi:hypothetical protein